MLNLFPLPNTVDPTGQRQYNFTDVLQNTDPRRDNILRVDYNIASKDTMFVRLLQDYQAQSGFGAILGADPQLQQLHTGLDAVADAHRHDVLAPEIRDREADELQRRCLEDRDARVAVLPRSPDGERQLGLGEADCRALRSALFSVACRCRR